MIQVTLEELTTEHILARSIFRENGELLLAAGYQMTSKVMQKLPSLGQNMFWVQEEGLEDVVPSELISEQISMQTQNELRENAQKVRALIKENLNSLEDVMKVMRDHGRFRNIITGAGLQNNVGRILSDILSQDATMLNLSNIRNKSSYTYQHSMNVAVTAIMLGTKFGYNRFELEELAMGCLLMDTGYLVLPEHLVNKDGRLSYSEFSMLKEHPAFGYSILRENPKVPLVTAHVAYQHHERQDGGGYPRRLQSDNSPPSKRSTDQRNRIHRYAEIAAVADTYISLSGPRPPIPPKSPIESIKILIKSAGSQLNRSIVDKLITMIPIFPVGSRIRVIEDPESIYLGFAGVVSKEDMLGEDRPQIILVRNKRSDKINPTHLDLRMHPDMVIQFLKI